MPARSRRAQAYSLKHGSNGSWAHRARNHPLIYHSWELTPAERAQTSAKLTYARALHMFGTSAELSPEEECDCHPADGMSKNRGNHLIDNHYYHEPRCGLNLTYFSTRGHWKVEGHRRGEYGSEPPGVAFRSILGRLGQSWELRWRWVLPPAECIERIVAPLHAHALVFNDGLWRALGAQAVDLRAVRNASAHAAPCVVWKTTTKPRAAERAPPDAEGREAFARDVIFEAGRMTERLAPTAADYVDKMHFRPEIYNALNVEMLRGLFGAPERPPGVPRTVGSWRCPKPGTHFPSPER